MAEHEGPASVPLTDTGPRRIEHPFKTRYMRRVHRWRNPATNATQLRVDYFTSASIFKDKGWMYDGVEGYISAKKQLDYVRLYRYVRGKDGAERYSIGKATQTHVHTYTHTHTHTPLFSPPLSFLTLLDDLGWPFPFPSPVGQVPRRPRAVHRTYQQEGYSWYHRSLD
eukprot:TRINITY_DN4151_c1_g1_i5.p1 TRINITY_DN4151_c1_g1~~TRINITY_DN4151_c1_g1_i5.p1  ORF type:complete len:168 (-),score=10.76 TRINITY_DN4151_c1_g1_i5:382-885(-)